MSYQPAVSDAQLRATPLPVSGTVAVTGAYQATQPVSIATMPTTPVTGTFWQATQPVSGTVSVSGSVAVTGTFWQATQPVSGTVTVGNASLAVTGTFFQATQPVSIAATVSVSGPLTDAQLRAAAVPVSLTSTTITGTVAATQSGTWNIGSITTLPALPAGTNQIGTVGIYDTELNYAWGTTALRDRLVAERYTILADSIADGFAPIWTTTTASGGTATVTTGEGILDTSANATGSAQMTSTAPAYYPGQVAWLNSAIRFNDTGSVGNIRRVGAFTVSGTTPQNGFAYELDGTTLYVASYKSGVATRVASASWIVPYTLDLNYVQLEIRWTSNSAWFYVNNTLRHTLSGGATAITGTLNFPITLQSINTSGTTSRQLIVRNIGMGRFGEPEITPVAINNEPSATFKGRVATFRTPGRAGTAGQKLFALHNATGSTRVVRVNKLFVDKVETVVKAVTVLPPVIRAHRFTVLPTNGTVLTKVAKDTALSSNASVVATGDASADGTGSATTLTVTIPAGSCVAQEFAPRLITAAGYEVADRIALLDNETIVLRALEGIVVFLDYVLATQNPTTDMWTVTCDWWEV